MQPLQCVAGLMEERALGAAVGLGRWFVGVAVLLVICGDYQRRRQHWATTAHRLCQCVSGLFRAYHGALQGDLQPLQLAASECLHWGQQQGWPGGLWEWRFCRFVVISREEGSTFFLST